jgi:hypothetical protein
MRLMRLLSPHPRALTGAWLRPCRPQTADHLFDASCHAREDTINGVSECIIMGVPIPLGTGLFKLLHQAAPISIPPRRTLLLRPSVHRLDLLS